MLPIPRVREYSEGIGEETNPSVTMETAHGMFLSAHTFSINHNKRTL